MARPQKPQKSKAKPAGEPVIKVLARNRRATHDYQIEDRLEAGLVLTGSEVKSLRDQKVSIQEGFVTIRGGEAYLVNAQILEYPQAHQQNHEPTRERKLLLHRREIAKLDTKLVQKGYSLVPMSIYIKNSRIKLEIGVGRGKKQYEKRESVKEAEAKREIDRAMNRKR